MNNILTEKEYQPYIMERLSVHNGYAIREAVHFAMDQELLFQFPMGYLAGDDGHPVENLQGQTGGYLRRFSNTEATEAGDSFLNILRHGVEISIEEYKKSLIFEYVTGKKEVRSDDKSVK